ncbi:unnamed protein product [Ceutorhynchus assimilis]|uniref:Complex III subunit 9 n=1 Tax=Ceutorhynchus assimilis TaxID=467358 RepID=A0A9N9MMA6_9CUCU|nr:unnamed protein product [Ceutorhynchus assimilis]
MALSSAIYNTLFKRTSTFALIIVGSAFFFERGFDLGCDTFFDSYNKGKQWKDIKGNYSQ